MAEPFPPASDLPPATPPTEAGPLELGGEPPAWPKVIGIISIAWAGLGLTCGGCGVVSMAFMPRMMKGAEAQMGPMPPAMLPQPAQLAMMVVALAWGVVLLIAGIMLVSRKPAARPMHLVYGVGSIVITLVNTLLSIQQQMALQEWFRQNPDSKWATGSSPVFAIIGIVFGVVLGLGWPVFCLIWFGLVKRRSAQIAEGVEELVA